MSYDGLNFAELSARFSSLRQAPLGDRRAPHKPLLILLMLGRYQRGVFRSLLFEEAQVQLKELLFEFGPPSRSINVLDPFWRLQNDGIWKVEDASGARVAETVAPPTASTLVDCTARGNFAPDNLSFKRLGLFRCRLKHNVPAGNERGYPGETK
jgi:putative restriction endonuclease